MATRRRLAAAGASSLLATAAYYDERLRRQIVIPVVGGAARLFVRAGNDLTLHDAHHLHAGLQRPAGTGMLTVSNHISTMDDPGLLAAIVPLSTLCDPDAMRWGVCAEDVCFRPGSWIERCASAAKVLPVARGGGVRQPQLECVAAKLQAGQWVHCAPPTSNPPSPARRLARRQARRLPTWPPRGTPVTRLPASRGMVMCTPRRVLPHCPYPPPSTLPTDPDPDSDPSPEH